MARKKKNKKPKYDLIYQNKYHFYNKRNRYKASRKKRRGFISWDLI